MRSPDAPIAARDVLCGLVLHPYERLIQRWNWKAALLSSLVRALLFFTTTLGAGLRAASGAAAAELLFRACTSGFYGAVTQAFVPVRPVRTGTLMALVVLPVLSHSLELAVHYARGTPDLPRAIGASVAFTVCSTAFNLFAMRNGALIVGREQQPIVADLRRLPGLLWLFAAGLINRQCGMTAR